MCREKNSENKGTTLGLNPRPSRVQTHLSDALTIKLLATVVISWLILLTNSHKDCIVQSHGVK